MPVGAKLPSTRIFAAELGVSCNTVLQVFETLTQEGVLASRVVAGRSSPPPRPQAAVRGDILPFLSKEPA